MMISTKGRYALRVMVDLAEHPTDEYTPLKEITDRQQISKEYLNSILKVLVQAGLLTSLRGKGGGYRLAYEPEDCSVGAILRTVEGSLAPVPCVLNSEPCPRSHHCASMPMWIKLDHMINDFFDGISLADLMENDLAGENGKHSEDEEAFC